MRASTLFQIKSTLVLIGLLLASFSGIAQNDANVNGDILTDVLENRQLLKEKFLKRDYQAVEELRSVLEKQTRKGSFIALETKEQLLLLVWMENFEKLIPLALNIDKAVETGDFPLKLTVNDFLFETLLTQTLDSIERLDMSIQQANIGDEEKIFVEIAYKSALVGQKGTSFSQQDLNFLCKKYLDAYPKGKFAQAIKQTYYVKEESGDYGYSTMIGGGIHISDSKYKKNFETPGLFGLDFDYHLRKFVGGISAIALFTKTNTDVVVDSSTVWQSNSGANNIIVAINAGYKPFQNKTTTLTLRAGYQYGWILPVIKDETVSGALEEYSVKMQGLRISAALSHSFFQRIISTPYYNRSNISKYGLQIQYALGLMHYSDQITNLSVSHSITVGLYLAGFNMRK